MIKENIMHIFKQNINENQGFEKFIPVIEKIKKLAEIEETLIVAIEGRCGSGKSSLSSILEGMFDCNVFRMDDFFLPFEMKTKDRLAVPGGNVHYERFSEEVLKGLEKHEAITYRPYNCSRGALDGPVTRSFKKISFVEGVYSMHPVLNRAYDYSIFLTLNQIEQIERIRRRSGEHMLQNFINKWIPLEEHYFSTLNIESKCDIVINTSI